MRGPSLPWLLPALALLACTMEKPAAPSFDTSLYLPLGDQKTTGLDLLEESEYITGDSTGREPLAFTLEGELEPFSASSALDVRTPLAPFEISLPEILLEPSDTSHIAFSVTGLIGGPPVNPEGEVVEPFRFYGIPVTAPPLGVFEWVRLREGEIRLVFFNNTPVPLGAAGDTALSAVLLDRTAGVEVGRAVLPGRVAPRARVGLSIDLAGRALHDNLQVTLRGRSPGSGGLPVPIHPTDGIEIDFMLQHLVADSALAAVPAQSVRIARSVAMDDDLPVLEADILDGSLHLVLETSLPVPASATLTFPDLRLADAPFPPSVLNLPAGDDVPQRVDFTVDLTGARLKSALTPLTRLRYVIDLSSEPSGDPVSLGVHQRANGSFLPGLVRFDRVTGLLRARRIEVEPTETEFDPPEGIEDLEFLRAGLTLQIESTISLPAEADLLVQSVPSQGPAVSLPIHLSIPEATPGTPARATVTVDEANSDILALIRSRPRKLILSGRLLAGGDGGSIGTLRRTDSISGAYRLEAPLRVRVGVIDHAVDPFRITFDREDQDRIREHARSGTVEGQVENHFPAGLTVSVRFAGRREDLESRPDVMLDTIAVEAGEVDGSGRVIRSGLSAFHIDLQPEDVQFFARDSLYGQVKLRVRGADPEAAVLITAADFVDVRGMLRLLARVQK